MAYGVYLTAESFQRDNAALHTELPFSEDISVLAQPLTVGGKILPNRLVCQAMEGCDGTPDGRPGALTRRRYDRLARGGAGLIWFEATAAMEEGRANPRQLYLNEQTLDSFRAQVDAIRILPGIFCGTAAWIRPAAASPAPNAPRSCGRAARRAV